MLSSIAGRLTLMFAVTTGVVSAAAGLALFLFQTFELRRHQASELNARFEIVQSMVRYNGSPEKWRGLKDKLASFSPPNGRLFYRVEGPDPRFTFGGSLPSNARTRAEPDGFGRASFGGRTFMTLTREIPAFGARPTVRLMIGADTAPVNHTSLILGAAVLILSVLTVAVVSLLGLWIVRRGLAPLQRLSQHAGTLNPDDPTLRLPDDALPGELGGLVTAFNGALDRLQQAYARLSSFNADVAHELRTPLSNLIGQTQVALSRARRTDELEEVLQSNLEELERLRSIINVMLFLARADQGAVAANLVPMSLAGLTRKSAEFLDVLFDEAGVALVVEGEVLVEVEPSLFGRAITNLLDNAIRHGTRPGRVTVQIQDHGPEIHVAVRNRGAPIPEDHLRRLFDRFYRPDPARENSGDSHGLGLAVVKAVALMHGGRVFAYCADGEVVIGFALRRRDARPLLREEIHPRAAAE
ncbi:heavy metal sensor histidine kinase [Phenylobacterium sp. LjRoot225]|uniref:heavy metal sensor histidine kinase n=1 Tax=Phenylobacterium sp. LjRoot225 TaxID=3342285 RepID=UPI003ECDB253